MFGYNKEHSPEVWHIPPGTPCINTKGMAHLNITENIESERTVEDTIHTGEERKQIKGVKVEATVQTVGYQPKQNNRGRLDEECKTAIFGKNTAYKKWIDKPTRSKRLEYESLQKRAHRICKDKKRIQIDNCVKNIEHNTEENNVRNAYKKLGHNPLETGHYVNYISTLSSYRAVKALRLAYTSSRMR
jgi:hypothetical protein